MLGLYLDKVLTGLRMSQDVGLQDAEMIVHGPASDRV